MANLTAVTDTINLKEGIYAIALFGTNDDLKFSGDFDITNAVSIIGKSVGKTIIDAQGQDRVFDIIGGGSGVDVTFRNLSIRGGLTAGNGGGIRADDPNPAAGFSDITLRDSIVTGNVANQGGGVYNEQGNVTLNSSKVTSNVGDSDGGGIGTSTGTVNLDGSSVSNNFSGNLGGGIFVIKGNVNLKGSSVSNNSADNSGGGLFINTGNVNFDKSTINGNTSTGNAGGIGLDTGNLNLVSSTFKDNFTRGRGGGISIGHGSVTLMQCNVSGNRSIQGGAGIDTDTASINLSRSTVTRNVTDRLGGGLNTNTGNITIDYGTVSDNTATTSGGGVSIGSTTPGAMLSIMRSTISGNSASEDGGISSYNGEVVVERSTLSGNRARNGGGGIGAFGTSTLTLTNVTISSNIAQGNSGSGGGGLRFRGTTATLLNVTITSNTAINGGGIAQETGIVNVKNTIIAQNSIAPAGAGPDVFGAFNGDLGPLAGHNLIGIADGSVGFTHGVNGNKVGTTAAPINPKLGVLTHNGGPTHTHKLLKCSLAIDMGDDTGAPTTDQRGVGRPRNGDNNGSKIADIGAFEL